MNITDAYMLSPGKSMTFICGVGECLTKDNGDHDCGDCDMLDCKYKEERHY